MGTKLYVGSLSWGTTDAGLRRAFEEFGELVEVKVITDRDTGRSRGFGFVTFAREEDATSAMNKLNGTVLDGRTIKVDMAMDRRPRRTNRDSGWRGSRFGR